MLSSLQQDFRELLDLVQMAENYDTTLATSLSLNKPIEPTETAIAERQRKTLRIAYLRKKWDL